MGSDIERLAIAHRIAMQDAATLLMRYQEAIDHANKTSEELKTAVDAEITRRRESQE